MDSRNRKKLQIPEIEVVQCGEYTLCPNCKEYYLTKDETLITEEETRESSNYCQFGGIIDTDEYFVTYAVCPLCCKKLYQSKSYVRTISTRDCRNGLQV